MKKWIVLFIIAFSCSQRSTESEMKTFEIDIQGHRGARGLLPENSIPGFLLAVELGVNTLELDLVVTGDSQLLVSHEPFFSPEFCMDITGSRVASDQMLDYNIYTMTLEQVRKFDCGSIEHSRFPDQRKMTVQKPLLKDVFDQVENLIDEKGFNQANYNIELKTRREWDNRFHPTPEVFADMVYQLITNKGLWDRVNIQSFDFRTLQYFRRKYPEVKLALLIENDLGWKSNIDSLGFTPEIYSCDYHLLSREIVADIKNNNMLVIPWTVNDIKEMKKLIDWEVNGIITDYPDRAIELIKTNE